MLDFVKVYYKPCDLTTLFSAFRRIRQKYTESCIAQDWDIFYNFYNYRTKV